MVTENAKFHSTIREEVHATLSKSSSYIANPPNPGQAVLHRWKLHLEDSSPLTKRLSLEKNPNINHDNFMVMATARNEGEEEKKVEKRELWEDLPSEGKQKITIGEGSD